MLISIITVTYNSAETLERTIKSVFSQTFKDIEYCIIDGGSTDATLDIIGKYAKEYPEHIKWISEKDRGIYDAMNKGVKLCTGDVIGILNSDDFFTSDDVLQHIADTFTRHPASEAVYGDVHFVSPDNLEKSIRYYSGYLFRPALTRFGFIAPHPSFYIRKRYSKSMVITIPPSKSLATLTSLHGSAPFITSRPNTSILTWLPCALAVQVPKISKRE